MSTSMCIRCDSGNLSGTDICRDLQSNVITKKWDISVPNRSNIRMQFFLTINVNTDGSVPWARTNFLFRKMLGHT